MKKISSKVSKILKNNSSEKLPTPTTNSSSPTNALKVDTSNTCSSPASSQIRSPASPQFPGRNRKAGFRPPQIETSANTSVQPITRQKASVKTVRVIDTGKGETFAQFYEKLDMVYDGGPRGTVMNVRHLKSGEIYVAKIREKSTFRGTELSWRKMALQMLNLDGACSHVLEFFEILEDDRSYYVVMERCKGGELFNFLLNENAVAEKECKRIMREILTAVGFLHDKGIVHRDIKPENIMFHDEKSPNSKGGILLNSQGGDNLNFETADGAVSPSVIHSPGPTLKLIDFDTCEHFIPGSPKSKKLVGTLGYIAPEGYLGEYSTASDLWSVGVILYILMTGEMPFDDRLFRSANANSTPGSVRMQDLYSGMQDFAVDWECPPWPSFPLARDLCQKLMAFDPGDRSPSAKEALKHPWLAT